MSHALQTSPPGPAEQQDADVHKSNIIFGFWVFIMTDCILFAALFAAFAVSRNARAGGPGPRDLFDLKEVFAETCALLCSSATCGFMMLAAHRQRAAPVILWLLATVALGLVFIGFEIHEFAGLISQNAGPDRSAFLSGFFTLVGTHGLHVSCGIAWLLVLLSQISVRGLTKNYANRLMCFSLFWHFLDIIWICLFTFVYLIELM